MRASPCEMLRRRMYSAQGIPRWNVEHRFHEPKEGEKKRMWRLDLAWPELKCGVEVHGGVFIQGRHNRGAGFTSDRAKMNTAQLQGWIILEVTTGQIEDGSAVRWIQEMIEVRTKLLTKK